MSSRRGHLRLRYGAGALVLALCGALAASAFGFVDVYKNPLKKTSQYRELKKAGKGSRCSRAFSKKRGVMEITVESAPKVCGFKPPVQGDTAKPNHRFDAVGRIKKTTNSNIRDDAYLTASVRVGGGKRFELRVFPKGKEFSLRRQPGGGSFPVNGTNPAIGGIGKQNVLRLTAEGDNIKAHVNGALVGDVTDAGGDVIGRTLEFGVGSAANSQKDTHGNFDRMKLSVPDP